MYSTIACWGAEVNQEGQLNRKIVKCLWLELMVVREQTKATQDVSVVLSVYGLAEF